MGRFLTTPQKALPDKVSDYLMKEAKGNVKVYIEKQFPKGKKNYNIG